jgi:putative ABC transport system ATP-binding protein
MLELQNISKIYCPGTINETVLFTHFDLTIDKGEFVSVVGSNGSGKTSMLNIICGSIPIEGGKVLVDGKDITRQKEFRRCRKIGRVYQNPAMGTCGEMTILENMAMADTKGQPFNLRMGVNRKRVGYYQELLSQLNLGLEDKLNVKVGSLSGGQRQAMALLMSTMTPIDFLILDEHTAALDPKTAEKVLRTTDKIISEQELTAMMVTHNMKDAIAHGNRLIMMHEGKIILDIAGEEKKNLTVPDLMKQFERVSGQEFASDKAILA